MKTGWIRLTLITMIISVVFNLPGQSVLNKFNILGRQKSIDIPFQYENHFILIRALLQKSFPLNFIFDTGAENTLLLKKEYSDLLGLKYDRRIRLIGSDHTEEMYALITRGIGFSLSPTISYSQDILVLEEDFFQLDELTGLYVDGIMSGSFFKSYITHINYKARVLSFIRSNAFRVSRKYVKIPIELSGGKIYVNASVTINNNKIPVKLLVDTGAGLPLLLYTDSNPNFRPPVKSIPGKLGKGLGGFLEGHIGKIQEFQLESFKFPNTVTSFQQLDSSVATQLSDPTHQNFRDGLIGNQLLNRFDIYIDYQKSIMYMSPSKNYAKGFNVDRSGLEILATGHELKQFLVSSVLPGSPADQAGIRKGDFLKKVVGLSTNLLSLEQIIIILARKGNRKIKVQYIRDGVINKTEILLRDLI